MRTELIKTSKESFLIFFIFHHIIVDRRSLDLFTEELFDLYTARVQGRKAIPKIAAASFAEYALEQEQKLKDGAFHSERQSLLDRFSGELPTLEIFTDYPRTATINSDGAYRQLSVSQDLMLKLRQSTYKHGCTPYVLALAALAVTLSRHTGQTDIIIGTPFAGRTDLKFQNTLGLFISMQPIRLEFVGNPSFEGFIAQTLDRVLEAQSNQNYPLMYLLRDLHIERESGRSPLFQTIFTYEGSPTALQAPQGLHLKPLPLVPNSAKFELSFTFREESGRAEVSVDFMTSLFHSSTIERLLSHWVRVLDLICTQPKKIALTAPILTPQEESVLIQGCNPQTPLSSPAPSVHELVKLARKTHPNRTAIVHGHQRITYEQLDLSANGLAHWLRARGAQRNESVVLIFDPGVDAITSMLAVLQAGSAYLPLDPAEPFERLRGVVTDSGAKLALCQQRYFDQVSKLGLTALAVDSPLGITQCSNRLPELTTETSPDDLMNILYTSGSTGVPKGVALPHKGILRLVYQSNFICLGPTDVVMQICPLNFDGATFEIWGPLIVGGSIVVADKAQVLSPPELGEIFTKESVTTLVITTPLLNRFIEEIPEKLRGMRNIVFGGEIISKPHIMKALEVCPDGVLIHTYGPTENSFTSCYYRIHEVQPDAWTIPIGEPVSQTEIYLLDDQLLPVPIGVAGEIYLSGAGLARGYLNDPVKTEEKFIPNPFAHGASTQKMYRTGDRGRRLENGAIEFIGRKDNQVKIRSQRVEIGEVEEVLRKHPLISECFVHVLQAHDGGKQLAAYLVPTQLSLIENDELRIFLRQRLPEYMIPTHFITLAALPLNPNGKVNRRALPSPQNRPKTPKTHRSETSIETTLTKIWEEVLGIKDINPTDHFFEIGGHSLSLMIVQRKIESATGVRLQIADLFRYPTLQELAKAIDAKTSHQKVIEPSTSYTSPRSDQDPEEMIALIGMAIRAPQANNLEEFWDNLKSGRDCISTFSEDEVDPATRNTFAHHDTAWVRAGGLLDDIYGFDPDFFQMTEFEARRMDPQQRLTLECVADAIENAGINLKACRRPISLYLGATPSTYGQVDSSSVSGAEALTAQANSHSVFMATRISYLLNLRGESIMIDTLCSTSLVAVHMACASLLTRSSSYALAGGVTITTPQKSGYLYESNFIMSPNGQCRTFDENASGTVPGNGAGIVLLRRLSDAIRDGDPIHAIIRGSAVNNDGHEKLSYYAPGVHGQAEVIGQALRSARITADSVSYVEAHGTATKLGDPIEIAALTQAYRESTSQKGFCGIGSVKSNIGHLGNAAGIAGLIKATLALKNGYIPSSIHFKTPNPNIDFSDSPFYVVSKGQNWERGSHPRRAGVSSYGIGGTNSHVILEEAP